MGTFHYTTVQISGFQPRVAIPRGVMNHFWRVASTYFMYTAVLYLPYSSFRWGSLGYSGLLHWVAVQKRLKTTGLDGTNLHVALFA